MQEKECPRKPAGILIRGAAIGIDYLILSLHFFPVTKVVKGVWIMGSEEHIWEGIFDPICAVFLVLIFAYMILFEGWWSRTPGKALLGMMVITNEGQPIGMRRSLIRFAGRFVDGIAANLVGVLIMLNDPCRRRMGDKWAGTMVIRRKSGSHLNQPSNVKES